MGDSTVYNRATLAFGGRSPGSVAFSGRPLPDRAPWRPSRACPQAGSSSPRRGRASLRGRPCRGRCGRRGRASAGSRAGSPSTAGSRRREAITPTNCKRGFCPLLRTVCRSVRKSGRLRRKSGSKSPFLRTVRLSVRNHGHGHGHLSSQDATASSFGTYRQQLTHRSDKLIVSGKRRRQPHGLPVHAHAARAGEPRRQARGRPQQPARDHPRGRAHL